MDEPDRPRASGHLELNLEAVKDYLSRQTGLSAAFLFGSFVTGRARRNSDVDVAVLYDRKAGNNYARFKDRLRMEDELEEICRRRVQVVDLECASPALQRQVRKYGRILLEADHGRRVEFEGRCRRTFLDMKDALALHTERRLRRLEV
ncbi:MAG: nucleotidyltransferase domain-containing protein [Peptococcaceae bacterium]|jgi:predicted nucleotidyltransferase|nr:nucleotidyltransferase domain-containing protein [Peptococcaceae bacterium]